MAGANKILKPGNTVFKAGDVADGMYLVRKGELVVYIEQAGNEVILARIGEGGMVGEMALFDKQPRSASVKASKDTEITHITLDEFGKLMKQIPKWFVGLMSSLSTRLRTTNDRLKQLESSASSSASAASGGSKASPSSRPFQTTLRILNILELLWHRDGTKEGKDWCLNKKIVVDNLVHMFGEDPGKVGALLDVLTKELIISTRTDNYKNQILVLANRGALKGAIAFLSDFVSANPNIKKLPESLINILRIIGKVIPKAPYAQFTSPMEEIMEEGRSSGYATDDWVNIARSMSNFGEAVKPVKTTTKTGVGLRVDKNEFPTLLRNLNTLNQFMSSNID